MNKLTFIAVLALLPVAAFAANNFDDEVNAELDKMYKTSAAQQSGTNRNPPTSVQVNVTNASRAQSDQAQVMEQAQTQAQKQPLTVIEASPLTESRSDKIRRARQEVEVQTEQKIVEKLEMSRIDDERKRAEILFGDKFSQMTGINGNNNTVVQQQTAVPVVVAPVATPVPVQEVSPVVVVHEKESKEDRAAEVRNEVSAALAEMKEKKPEDKWQIGGLLGVGEYPDVRNVKGSYALGVTVGKKYQDHLIIEGSFIYSNFQVEQQYGGGYDYMTGQYYPRITEMDQYQGGITTKYQFGNGMLRPVIGLSLAYTYRSFTDTQFAAYNSDATSTAVDAGLVTGLDAEVSDNFSIGLDLRYMMNLTSRNSGAFQRSYHINNSKPIEKLSYYTLGIVGRSSF